MIEPNIDFGVVNHQVNIGVAPTVGHKILKGFYAGTGAVFIYSGTRNAGLTEINGRFYSTNANNFTYGGGIYLHYHVWKGLFIRTRADLGHRQIDDLNRVVFLPNIKTGQWMMQLPLVKINIPDLPVSIDYNLLLKKQLFFFNPVIL